MNHEIDLSKYQIHTDLAIDALEQNGEKISNTVNYDGISVTSVYLDKETAKKLNKKQGNYITIQFEDVTDYNNRKLVEKILTQELKKILKTEKINEDSSCLVIGLGNEKSTPDSLGPLVLQNVLITNHLFMYGNPEEGFRKVYGISPGVMGQTGIETSDLISGIIKTVSPDFVIVIDALASQSITRVNKTIQITNTGIHPGSGIGNQRKEISKETTNIPVIALGIPTVVDAVTIVSDTINYMYQHFSYTKENINSPINKLAIGQVNYLKKNIHPSKEDKLQLFGMLGNLTEEETKQLIFEVLTPIGYNLMVTPKEVDFMMDNLGLLISNSINSTLHKKVK